MVHGVLQGLLFAWALSGFGDPRRMLQAVVVGLVASSGTRRTADFRVPPPPGS
ncbi:hypothetical protein ACFW9L_37380 [Streptomyces sp. NPDC059517]|uniref:hypothetical protein n=1 Tax=Streptomyces sp. NPDC059517 TaxID=3346855 RepID=UPI0036AEBD05